MQVAVFSVIWPVQERPEVSRRDSELNFLSSVTHHHKLVLENLVTYSKITWDYDKKVNCFD